MSKSKDQNRPPAPPGAVAPRDAEGQAQHTEQTDRLTYNCQGPAEPPGDSQPPPPNERALSKGEVDTVLHTLHGDVIHSLAAQKVEPTIADEMLSASCEQVLKAAKKKKFASNNAVKEALKEELEGRIVGLRVFPEALAHVAANFKAYAKRLCGSTADAEDGLQQALLHVFNNPGRFAAFTRRQAIAVLRGTARKARSAEFRKQRRVVLVDGEEIPEPEPGAAGNHGCTLEFQEVTEVLKKKAPLEVQVAVDFQDRKAAGEKPNRTIIERASRARQVVAKVLNGCGVDTTRVYRKRSSRAAAEPAQPTKTQPAENDNALPDESMKAQQEVEPGSEESPPESGIWRRK